MRREVEYLGHVVSEKGVLPNPEKTKAISTYPVPKNQKQIKQFLGLVGYYRRHVNKFAEIAKPLTSLLKKDAPFLWSESQQAAFERFKSILCSEPILQYPHFSKVFILTTDASNFAISGILSQGDIGKDLPISYSSRTLNKSEINYSTTEKELLAIVWSTNHFRPYLYGRKFIVITDHRPLTWLFNCKDPSSRLVRWKLKLQEYDFEIRYKPGKINCNADALSRNSILLVENQSGTYDEFIKYHYKSNKVPEIEILKENIFAKFPNAFFYSKDLDENNMYHHNMSAIHDLNSVPQDVPLYSTITLQNSKNQITFLILAKTNFFDSVSYKELFYSLIKLRKSLLELKIPILYLKNPCEENTNIKQDVFNELLEFIFLATNIKIILVNKPRIQPQSKDEIKQILKENHNNSIAGHSGYLRTYKRIKENYKWPNMKKDIRKFIKTCESCQINKSNSKQNKAKMEITTTSERPFQRIAVDIVGPLPLTENGNRFIITLQDDLTKFSYAKPIPNHEAATIASKLLTFITLFGIPEAMLSDQGSDFTSSILKELNKLFKICVFSSPYHPQTNGALERSHLTLKDYLKHYINQNQNDWDQYVELAMFTYNTHVHKSTSYTPFELIFGHKPVIPSSLTSNPEFRYSYDDYYSNLKLKFNKSYQIARDNLIRSKERSKIYYDSKSNEINYQVGSQVLLQTKQVKLGLNKKLSPNFKGPYKIVKINDNKTVDLEIKPNKCVTYHLNLIKPFFPDDTGHD